MARFNKNTGKLLVLLLLAVFFGWFFMAGRSGNGDAGKQDTPVIVQNVIQTPVADTVRPDNARITRPETVLTDQNKTEIPVKGADAASLVAFAKTLLGVPYVYASADPGVGFDCSGFITYVFNHFNIEVPRSSIDFSNVGRTVEQANARQGDLILFTGTNELERYVGHMGIVVSNDATNGLQFIHATSGKAMCVTISPMSEQYKRRFVRVCRVF